nr:polysaccharide biosynthesis C-terminal domain-containing protein [Bacillus subtilis]
MGAGVAVKWVLNTLLVPRYGIEGASLATVASFAAVAGTLTCISFGKRNGSISLEAF